MIRIRVSEWMFLVAPAHPGSPGQMVINGCFCVVESGINVTVKPQIEWPRSVGIVLWQFRTWNGIQAGFTETESSFRLTNWINFVTESETGFSVKDQLIKCPLKLPCVVYWAFSLACFLQSVWCRLACCHRTSPPPSDVLSAVAANSKQSLAR